MPAARTPRTRRKRTRTKESRWRCLGEMARELAAGHGPTEVARAAAAKYGIALSSAWHDLAEVRRIWAAEAERERGTEAGRIALGVSLVRREELFRLALRNGDVRLALELERDRFRREELFRLALRNGDVRLALELERDRCRLLGLYPDQGPFPEPAPGPELSLAHVPTELLMALERLLTPPGAAAPGPAAGARP